MSQRFACMRGAGAGKYRHTRTTLSGFLKRTVGHVFELQFVQSIRKTYPRCSKRLYLKWDACEWWGPVLGARGSCLGPRMGHVGG